MPRPDQAVNPHGYPGVAAGATELDIEAVPTSRTVRNSREFNMAPPTKIYYLIWQLQESSTLSGHPLGIYQLCLFTQARYESAVFLRFIRVPNSDQVFRLVR